MLLYFIASKYYSFTMHQRLSLLLMLLLATPAMASEPVPPKINARAWLLVDHNSRAQLAEHAGTRRFSSGHLNKLMTAYGVFRALEANELSLTDEIEISKRAATSAGTRMFAPAGSTLSAKTLLQATVVGRANDAAIALAEQVASDEQTFVSKMNHYAEELGLGNTRYSDACGLETSQQYTSAVDSARLVTALINDYPQYYHWFGEREFAHDGVKLYNRNALLWRDENIDGVIAFQSGRDGFHLIASGKRGKMRLTAVVLGAPSERASISAGQQLLNYGFDHYETRRLYRGRSPAVNLRVWLGDAKALPVGTEQDLYLTLRRGTFDRLQAKLRVDGSPYAPVAMGQQMGSLSLYLGDSKIGEHKLIALKNIGNGGIFSRTLDYVEMWLRDIPDSANGKWEK
jgi:D-alanyl-D-alanine carboxypeptidase (penicillin-binding protein 5/6)